MKIHLQHPIVAGLAALCMWGGTPVRAATTLSLGPSSGSTGASLAVPLEIHSGDGVTAIQFDLLYDTEVAHFNEVRAGNSASGHTVDFATVDPGRTRVVVVSTTNQMLADGTMVDIDLDLLDNVPAGTRSVSFSNVILSDTGGTQVAISWAPYVQITSPAEGQRFAQSASVGLSAIALDYDSGITSVEFFADGSSISMDSSAPYTASWTATGSGSVILTAVAVAGDSGQGTSNAVTVQVGPAPYNGWFTTHFTPLEQNDPDISGLTADPDQDLIPNLLEYALGLDPKQVDLDGLPLVGTVEVGPDHYATLTYRANPIADDVEYTVEVSGSGSNWSSGTSETEEMSSSMVDGKQEVVTRDLSPITSGLQPNRLMRLTVRLKN